MATTTDALGRSTTSTYDEAGDLAAVTDPTGATTTYEHDVLGRTTSTTDADGVTTTTVYDRRGNVAETRDGAGGVSSTAYDAMNRPTGVYDADGVATWYSYDLAGQVVEERRNRSTDTHVPDYWEDRTTYTYDADGRRTGTTDPRGNVPGADPAAYTTTVQYDDDGRPVASTDPLGRTTAVTYDAAGRRLTAMDPAGGVTTSAYDATGLLTSVTSPDGSTTSYGYDTAGRLVERTDALGRVTSYAYDAAGRETSRTDPLGRTSATAYDATGQVTSMVAPSGTETTDDPDDGTTAYTYDDAGRLTERSFSDGTPSFAYTYTDAGRPLDAARVQSGVTLSATANHYDDLGRLVGTTRTGPGAVDANYSYTAAGRLAGASWSSGMTISYGYNSVGQLITATPGGVSGLTAVAYGYDPAGNPISTTRAGSKKTVSTSTYDGAGQLTALTHLAGTTVVADYALAYDARGNPSHVTASAAGQPATTSYAYDEVNRLTLECRPSSGTECTSSSPATAYGYDAVGNRITQEQRSVSGSLVTTDSTTTSTYDDADQLLTQVVDGVTTLENTWSQDGTLASSETHAGTRTFGFDLAGEMGAVGLEDGTYVAFTYDAQGNRTSRSQDGVLDVSWSWDDVVAGESVRVGEDAAASSPDSAWLPDPTSGTAAPLAAKRGSTTSWLLTDPFGSAATSVRPGTTTITGRQTFTAFGLALAPATGELAGQGVGYLGQYLDATVGEYDLRARSYDAASGRFTAPDPGGVPTGMPFANGYAYAFNNPLLLHDITGEWAECGPIGSVCDGSNLIPVFNRMSRDFDDAGYLALHASLTSEQADEIGYDDLSYIHIEAANRLDHMQVCANNPGQCAEPCPDEGYHGCVAWRATKAIGSFALGQLAGAAFVGLVGRACVADARAAAGTSRVFASGDAHVGSAANAIEAALPGLVVSVNGMRRMSDGLSREVDIDLGNVRVQVKGGNARGLLAQINKTQSTTGTPTIGYAPEIGDAAWRNAANQGIAILRTPDELVAYLKEFG
ncbi:RHS repeat-associated core domain-containing protein [Cellulomonas sp. NPDC058312]|uniref:RHS repeat-associated core domain-containing protein n=1 Tax=Cellulomonas sp. NPDC058312 TaxID=3346441 RepID=UPI0036E10C6E